MKQRSLYRSACALLAALLMLVSAVVTSVPAFAGEKASFTVSYYDYKGAVIRKDTVTAGDTTRPPTPPALEGRKFAHWYVVNDDLKGDLAKKFDFGTAVSRDLNLKTHYEPLAQKSAPASEKQAEAPAEPPAATPVPETKTPATEAPLAQAPAAEPKATNALAKVAPATEAPATEAPATKAPVTEIPATETPVTEVPATEAPATDVPGATNTPEPDKALTMQAAGQSETDKAMEPVNTPAPESTAVPEETAAPENTAIPEETAAPENTAIPEETAAPENTAIPEENPAAENTAVPEETPAPENTAVPEETPVPESTAVPEETAVPENTAIPEETPAPESTGVPETSPEPDGTLISETEVTAFLAYFYNADGTELMSVPVNKGEAVTQPDLVPESPEGLVFAYWYQVDAALEGDAQTPYDFTLAVQGLTYLMACHRDPAVATPVPDPGQDEGAPVDEVAAGSASLLLNVELAFKGGQAEDGVFRVSLNGDFLKDGPLTAMNSAGKFVFPELVFTAADAGVWRFTVKALPDPDSAEIAYDTRAHEVLVTVFMDEEGRPTALASYPDGGAAVRIQNAVAVPSPLVRVYVNVKKDQTLKLGDKVRFTAQTVNCGENPRYQWQFSADNVSWQDVPGAKASTMDIVIARGNAAGYWRVGVTITD